MFGVTQQAGRSSCATHDRHRRRNGKAWLAGDYSMAFHRMIAFPAQSIMCGASQKSGTHAGGSLHGKPLEPLTMSPAHPELVEGRSGRQ